MLPYYGMGVTAIGAAYKIGKIMRGVEYTARKVNDLAKIKERFEDAETTHKLCMEGKLKGSPYQKK